MLTGTADVHPPQQQQTCLRQRDPFRLKPLGSRPERAVDCTSGIPALAVLFQFVNWAFVAACALWLARFVCTRARSRRRRQRDQLDEEEVQGLLDS